MTAQDLRRVLGTLLLALILTCSWFQVFIVQGEKLGGLGRGAFVFMTVLGLVAIFNILRDGRPYSLYKMHWCFLLVFMVFAPMSQMVVGYSPWGYGVSSESLLKACFVLLVWTVVFELVHRIVPDRDPDWTSAQETEHLHDAKRLPALLVSASIAALALKITLVGFSGLLLRGAATLVESLGTWYAIVLDLGLMSATVCAWVLVLHLRGQGKARGYQVIIVTVIALLMNWPTAVSRYWVGAVYLGAAVILCQKHLLRSARLFDLGVFGALVVIFPAMGVFKAESDQSVWDALQLSFTGGGYASVDYDAFSMLCRIVEYVDVRGTTLGEQLAGVVFFFVPRVVADMKGTPTGELVAAAQGASFINVSAPLMGEGYINFGWLGVCLFACVSSLLVAWIDNRYWRQVCWRGEGITLLSGVYPFLLGWSVFLYRGALQPTWLRLMGFLLVPVAVHLLWSFTAKGRRGLRERRNG